MNSIDKEIQNIFDIYNFLNDIWEPRHNEEVPKEDLTYDCIIALGCKDDGIAASCVEFCERYKIKNIIFSGKGGKNSTGIETEASTFKKRFLKNNKIEGINPILEENATNTWENIKNSKRIMKENGFKSALIICKPYQKFRAKQIAELYLGKDNISFDVSSEKYSFLEYLEYNQENSILTEVQIIQEIITEIIYISVYDTYLIFKDALLCEGNPLADKIILPNEVIQSIEYFRRNNFSLGLIQQVKDMVSSKFKAKVRERKGNK